MYITVVAKLNAPALISKGKTVEKVFKQIHIFIHLNIVRPQVCKLQRQGIELIVRCACDADARANALAGDGCRAFLPETLT